MNKIFTAFLLLCQIAAFDRSAAAAPADTGGKIGIILPLSGSFARYGEQIQSGIRTSGLPQEMLVFEDEGCDPKRAVTAYKKLTDLDSVKLFLGPWCGSPQMALAPLIKAHEQLAVLGSSAPRDVFELSGKRMFSSQHTIEDESTFLAKSAYRLGARKVAIIFFENSFSRAHEKAFRAAFAGSIAATFAYTTQDISELKSIALRIRGLGVDALYVPDAFPLMGGLTKELGTIGLGKIPLFSVYSAQSADVLTAVGKAGEGIIYSYPDIGSADALDYFPSRAAAMLAEVVKNCGQDSTCGRTYLLSHYRFSADGVVEGGLKLKTIRGGKFADLSSDMEKEWLATRSKLQVQ